MTKYVNSISEICGKYDYFIVDLWGVLHDGHDPYKGAQAALKTIKDHGKVVLLSNAPRRAVKAKTVLENLGFPEDYYDLLLTSGEVTFNHVKEHPALGKKYYYVGPDKDLHLLDGLGLTQVKIAQEADFAIATGFEGFGSLFEEKKHQLDECLAAGIPLLVANPDKVVVKQTGEEQICAGIMGEYYIEHGGKIEYFGKPYKNAYAGCMEFFGSNDNKKILCIGDSLHTDIAGANNIGADSVFITGGIHRKDLFEKNEISEEKLESLIKKENTRPTYFMKEFC